MEISMCIVRKFQNNLSFNQFFFYPHGHCAFRFHFKSQHEIISERKTLPTLTEAK